MNKFENVLGSLQLPIDFILYIDIVEIISRAKGHHIYNSGKH